ncbi:hypothetical protein SASPL_102499 [Salvia splendens]|uniref:Uncharacterized protein n=1 Tax=Salvia splendens TaxID=180675 RepID=A0A8X8YRA9_SALSN|nr:hypothetical protein SASPL_102499 [Salvia splendens]
MPVMDKLKIFVVQEPVVAASCLIAGVGLFLPAVVRPILDSYGKSNQGPKTYPLCSALYCCCHFPYLAHELILNKLVEKSRLNAHHLCPSTASLGITVLLLFSASKDTVFCSDPYYPVLLICRLNT